MDRARQTARRTRVVAVPVLAVVSMLSGCVVQIQRASVADVTHAVPAAETRPEIPKRDLPWPDRFGDRDNQRGVIVPLEGPLSIWQGVWLGEHHAWRSRKVEYDDAAALGKAFGAPSGFDFRTEGPGSFLFVRDRRYSEPDPPPVPEFTDADPAEMFKFVSAKVTRTWGGVPGVELQRTWFGLYDPSENLKGDRTQRGTIVLMPGMFGTPEPVIESLIKSMRDRGWSVLRMLSHPSRFTERLEVHVDADPSGAARIFAEELTDRAAECAYAASAAVQHAHTLRPELADKPTVLLGMSGGAIALPTVFAYDPDAYDASVLIAGGVNFLGINLASNYASFIDAVHAQWGDLDDPRDPTQDEQRALAMAYLEHAALDGHHLAEALTSKPTLIIHGSSDRAVPAVFGDQLWERAGKPERWVFPVGHELVFLALPTQAGRMHRWLVENLELEHNAGEDDDEVGP
ncbi:MAG: alpha/beta hydrolase [Phycisphaerales bacterium]